MAVVDSIPAWLSVSPYEAAAASATDSSASTCAAEADRESAPASSSLSSSANAQCLVPNASSSPFPDCDRLSDTLLAKIAAGNECLASIASFHNIPYPRFTLWLLEPSTQARLAALSVAIASAARLTATAALPDIVRDLKTTVDQLTSQTHMTIAPPGANHLLAESVILRRHRALIAAASLIYRISRFTCPSLHPRPQHEPPPRTRTHTPTSRDNSAATHRNLAQLPRLDLAAIEFADPDPRPARDSASVRAAASELLPRQGEVAAEPPEGAPVFSTDSSRLTPSPSSASRFPSVLSVNSVVQLQVSASELARASDKAVPTEEAIQTIIEDFDLTNEQVVELRKDPPTWIRENLLKQNGLIEVKPRRKRRARKSADDG